MSQPPPLCTVVVAVAFVVFWGRAKLGAEAAFWGRVRVVVVLGPLGRPHPGHPHPDQTEDPLTLAGDLQNMVDGRALFSARW